MDTTTNVAFPEWLTNKETGDPIPNRSAITKQIEKEAYIAHFDRTLAKMCMGMPFRKAAEDPRIDTNQFYSWIIRDHERKQRYEEAQSICADLLVQECLDISDAEDTLEDVQRSALKINTRMKIAAFYNRKRFGEVKQIEQTVTLDISEAMRKANERLLSHSGTQQSQPVTIEGEVVNGDD